MDEFLLSTNENSNMRILNRSDAFRKLKRGCLGCVIIIFIAVALLVCLLAFALSQIFAKPAHSAGSLARRAILLTAAVPPAQNALAARGEFLKREVVIEYAGGEIFLASSEDARGALVTDDWAELNVAHEDGTRARWIHDFRNGGRTQIVALPAQAVTKLFRRGRNVVTLTLRDLTPFTYWSAPYYLVVEEGDVSPTRLYTVTRAVTPTRVATRTRGIGLPVNVESPKAVSTNVQTGVPTHTPTPMVGIAGEVGTGIGDDSFVIPLVAFGALGIVSLIFFLVLLRARHKASAAPTLMGWIDLFDVTTRESEAALDLSKFANGVAVLVDPLRVEAWNGQEKFFAALEMTTEGIALTRGDLEMDVGAREILNDGARVVLGKRVELEYRNVFG